MRISAKTKANVLEVNVKGNKNLDGKEAYVDFAVAIEQRFAYDFGEDFETIAFSTMRQRAVDNDGSIKFVHLLDSIKPGKRATYEPHAVNVDCSEFFSTPEILKITPVDGSDCVIARIRVPIESSQKHLIQDLVSKVCKTVDLQFVPKQCCMFIRTVQNHQTTERESKRDGSQEGEHPEQDRSLDYENNEFSEDFDL